MRTSSTVDIIFARSLPLLMTSIRERCEIVASVRESMRPAIVIAPEVRKDLVSAAADAFCPPGGCAIVHSRAEVRLGVFASALRRSRWATADIDAKAPRLRRVKLPRHVLEADALIGLADLRATSGRPVISLGLWAGISSPIHRLGSRLGGPREGIAAEIGLAVKADALLVIGRARSNGVMVGFVSSDPIATELVALAFLQVGGPGFVDLPGPWEDPLIQHATELGLGASHPSEISCRVFWGEDIVPADREASIQVTAVALARIGVSRDAMVMPESS